MKIIHCSDIHLDSRMESNLTAAQARERNAEICATFARMAAFAVREQVSAVLIAGDLFDTQRVSAQTAGFVLDRIRSAANVDFFYLRGNHDESRDVFGQAELPENFKTFGSDWTYHRIGDLVLAGLELDRENAHSMYDTLRLNPEDTNIVLLHGQVSTQPGEELIALPKLKNKGIDYLALGHIHSYQTEPWMTGAAGATAAVWKAGDLMNAAKRDSSFWTSAEVRSKASLFPSLPEPSMRFSWTSQTF